jgi:DNA-binding NarL/FixJ family response regulator
MLSLVLGRLRVLLVEDAGLMRDGLAALLRTEPGVEVIGAVANSARAVRLATATSPDLALVDLTSASDIDTIAVIRERWPSAHILVLTGGEDERIVEAALHAGAGGFVLRSGTRAELMAALHKISEGRPPFSPASHERVDGFETESRRRPTAVEGAALLTDREREIMQCVASGLRTREIAQRLSLSHKTVEKHRSNLMRKLGLRSAAAVAAYAIAKGYGRG